MLIKKYLVVIAIQSLFSNAWAAGYQRFYNITYDNPANLKSVKQADIILGDSWINIRYSFNGTNGPYVGQAISHQADNYPYGRLAFRIDQKLVIGLDVTHLVYANIQYPINSIIQSNSTETIFKDVDFGPRFSYEINPDITIGAGLNVEKIYNAQINFVKSPFGNVVNKGSSWAYGWNGGLVYVYSPKTNVNISYYSQIVQDIPGVSTWGPIVNTNFRFVNIPIPAVISLGANQIVTEKLSMNLVLRYQLWSIFNQLIMDNTALNQHSVAITNYNNSWISQLIGRYKWTDSFTGLGGVEYDSSPVATPYRGVVFPAYSLIAGMIGGEYTINKHFSTKLIYAQAFSNPPIDKLGPVGLTKGNENVNGSLLDLSLIAHF